MRAFRKLENFRAILCRQISVFQLVKSSEITILFNIFGARNVIFQEKGLLCIVWLNILVSLSFYSKRNNLSDVLIISKRGLVSVNLSNERLF